MRLSPWAVLPAVLALAAPVHAASSAEPASVEAAPVVDARSVEPGPAEAGSIEADPAEAAAPETPVPLLWSISDDDNTVYLLGSFHLLRQTDYPTGSELDAAFDDAERVVFEVPPEQLASPETAMKMLDASRYADGRSLSKVLDAPQMERLRALFDSAGQSVAAMEAYEPWFVNLSLVIGMSQAMGFDGQNGLDQHLIKRAAKAGKPVSGLESIDEQLAALDGMPMDEQVFALDDFATDPAQASLDMVELHDAWRRGDADALEALAVSDMKDNTPESYRLVNVVRNEAWLPKIRAYLETPGEDDVLVVVGAMHLLGEDGIVARLADEGLVVERICPRCATLPADAQQDIPVEAAPEPTPETAPDPAPGS